MFKQTFCLILQQFNDNKGFEKLKRCSKMRCRIFKIGHHRHDSWAPSSSHRDTQITCPLHRLVLKSPSSSLKLYTYTKLRTPVFIVKRCYAYLYCMYVYPSALELCSFIYPKVKCINNQYFEAKSLQLL